ncbi:HNH endonuclease signature motif containing protein [Antrihabitans stalactiti]|uniref:DUF222 domain-containing protein n=1 Tax=Antrihabitans stalactiti TaxID=2584121 RepID=A0A848KHC6_9NOCA|nr:HNH endonuclease signature motif containing protein [Antrihabitans stalactiti]NMN96474.1 DUF222 domain-containing protein [Antrihabitans stalactiti]
MSEQASAREADLALLAEIAEAARVEAAAAAHKIALVKRYHETRSDIDTPMPGRSALAEVALELATTYGVVSGWLHLSYDLERVTDVEEAFGYGEIKLPNIRTIVDHTRGVERSLLMRLEPQIITAAERLAPRALGTEIDRILIEADPEWTKKSRERAEATRSVSTRPLPNGMALLKSKLTATEATEINGLIAQLTTTVCDNDPREPQQRQVDAFLALLRGHTTLGCRCDDPDCVHKTADPTAPAVRLNIMCGLETLLGIANNPVYLAGYGALDADKARDLADDATWQALITTATAVAETFTGTEPPMQKAPPATTRDGQQLDPMHPRSNLWLPTCPDAGLGPDAGIVVARSKVLPAGTVLPKGGNGIARTRVADAHRTIETLRRQILDDPHRPHAEFPDGHGGFTTPPPGALTYRPTDTLAMATRLRDGTCRHPGCTVPADQCQLDHIVEFLLANPLAGGWTILANLQCLCINHHQLKTAKLWTYEMLRNAIIHTTSPLGQHGLSLPAYL